MSENNNSGIISFYYVEGSRFYSHTYPVKSDDPCYDADNKIAELKKNGFRILSVHFITHEGFVTDFIIEYKPK